MNARLTAWPPVEVLTVLPCQLPTARVHWHADAWAGPAPIVVVELGVMGLVPWRLWLGRN